jgi:hypothetical protein
VRDRRQGLGRRGKQGKRDTNDSSTDGSPATATSRRVRKDKSEKVQPRGTNDRFAEAGRSKEEGKTE